MKLTFRRNYPILIALLLVLAFFSLFLGGQRVIAYTFAGAHTEPAVDGGMDIGNEVDLFDDTVVHSLQVIMDEDDYQMMLTTYQQTGEKDYFHADIIIDGVRVYDVGIRLKGNSSLMTALGGGMGERGAEQDIQRLPEGMDPGVMPGGFDRQNLPEGFDPGAMPGDFDPGNLPEGFDPGAMPAGEAPGGMFAAPSTLTDGETKIPYLVSFDEYVPGQTYQGHTRLALRTYGITYDEAMLEEPLTNDAFQLAGLSVVETAYTGLQINDGEAQLYALSEVVDDPIYLARSFAWSGGVLYKAEVGSSLTYLGDDPSSYATSFSQETRQNEADMAPLIEFSRFLTESTDAEFESQLPERLDVDAFATYLALTNLLVNNDSIVGMNNNYYLYYDDTSERFTLLYWDGNESLGGLGMGESATFDLYFLEQPVSRMPGGGENVLLERFKANQTFMALYEQKLEQVYAAVFQSGAILAKVDEIAALIHAVNTERSLVDIEQYDQAVEKITTFLQERMLYVDSIGLMDE